MDWPNIYILIATSYLHTWRSMINVPWFGRFTLTKDGKELAKRFQKRFTIKMELDQGIFYYFNEMYHREDGPAIQKYIGSEEWYLFGKRHRIDGPAIEHDNGTKEWYDHGKRHRIDGPALIHPNGHEEWYLNGDLHRIDGPAIEYSDGTKGWFKNGLHHRRDGPAIIR